jgi:acetyl esterase/lipase
MKTKLNDKSNLLDKLGPIILSCLNLINILGSIWYLISPGFSISWTIFGIIQLLTYGLNLGYAAHLINSSKERFNWTSHKLSFAWVYVVVNIIAMLFIFLGNFMLSVSYSNGIADNFAWFLLVILGNLGLSIIFLIMIKLNKKNEENENDEKDEIRGEEKRDNQAPKKHISLQIRLLTIIISVIILLFAIIYALTILFGASNFVFGIIGILCAQFAIFFFFIFLSGFILINKLKMSKWSRPKKIGRTVVCTTLGLIFLLPLLSIPTMISEGETNFRQAFGQDYESKIDAQTSKFFMPNQYSLPGYFLGIPADEFVLREHVLFYEGTNYRGGSIKLYFDAYLPPNTQDSLPGKNSTLIRIHGGGWSIGDKARGNMLQINKYFASQGYVVFDVQYGLNAEPSSVDPITPQYVIGNFSTIDMMAHLGIFTDYLYNHSGDYGANLNSTFISGGSAGGHLCMAMTLAMQTQKYPNLFPSAGNYTIKGMVPFYPANGHAPNTKPLDVPELIDPGLLINSSSPPCLIYHGTQDGMVDPQISVNIKKKYTDFGIKECAIIWQPFGGHANDIYYSGSYSQVFIYYMERFLYLYQ